MTTPTDYTLSVSDAAHRLGVHPDTVRRWTDDGKLAAWVMPGGQRRYRLADLAALLPGSETTEATA